MPKKILIVDDEKLITETLGGMLRHSRYEAKEGSLRRSSSGEKRKDG